MALDPILWALKDAPTADSLERLVLVVFAEHADEDGCNAFPSLATVARHAQIDQRSVQRRVRSLVKRRMLVRGNQKAANVIPKHLRPAVYDVQIPYSWFGSIDRINEYRKGRGREPLSRSDRPDLVSSSGGRKKRSDVGRKRPPKASAEGGGDYESGGVHESGGDSWPGEGVTSSQGRGCLAVTQPSPMTLPNDPPPPPPTSSTTTAPVRPARAGRRIEEEEDGRNPQPEPRTRTPALTPAAFEIVADTRWPTGHAPSTQQCRQLAAAVQQCLHAGHPRQAAAAALAGALDGARSPVGSAVAALRQMAAMSPSAVPAAPSSGRSRLAGRPTHTWQPDRVGDCHRCKLPERHPIHDTTRETVV